MGCAPAGKRARINGHLHPIRPGPPVSLMPRVALGIVAQQKRAQRGAGTAERLLTGFDKLEYRYAGVAQG